MVWWWCFCHATTFYCSTTGYFVMVVGMHSIHFKWSVCFFSLFNRFLSNILSAPAQISYTINLLPSRNTIYGDEANHYWIFISINHIEWTRRLSPLTDLNRLESVRECKFVLFVVRQLCVFLPNFFLSFQERKKCILSNSLNGGNQSKMVNAKRFLGGKWNQLTITFIILFLFLLLLALSIDFSYIFLNDKLVIIEENRDDTINKQTDMYEFV